MSGALQVGNGLVFAEGLLSRYDRPPFRSVG